MADGNPRRRASHGDDVGQATTAPALFIIGGYLMGRSLRGRMRSVIPHLVSKLLVHPVAVGVLVFAFQTALPALGPAPLDPALCTAAIVSASVPTISNMSVLAVRHGQEEAVAAASFAGTLVAAVSLTGVLLVLGAVPGSGV